MALAVLEDAQLDAVSGGNRHDHEHNGPLFIQVAVRGGVNIANSGDENVFGTATNGGVTVAAGGNVGNVTIS